LILFWFSFSCVDFLLSAVFFSFKRLTILPPLSVSSRELLNRRFVLLQFGFVDCFVFFVFENERSKLLEESVDFDDFSWMRISLSWFQVAVQSSLSSWCSFLNLNSNLNSNLNLNLNLNVW
jgi:hypothetical protein